MFRKTADAFVECQQSVVNELGYIMNEMNCGRYEEAYNATKNLHDEIYNDIQISKGKEPNTCSKGNV